MLYVISSSPGERRACLSYLCTVAWLSPLPGGGALTPIYALKRARSGSDRVTVSTSPLPVRPRRYHHSVVCRTRFHEVARAAGAKRHTGKLPEIPHYVHNRSVNGSSRSPNLVRGSRLPAREAIG